jgi:RHS repeat-associated protein
MSSYARQNAHRGDQLLPASLPRTRTLLTARRSWRNRVSVRRRASGRVHYNYFRDYDPATGRYVQSDPIGLRGGINTYSYGFNNPTRYVDPDGRIAFVIPFLPAIGEGLLYLGSAAATAWAACEVIDAVEKEKKRCAEAEDTCFAECEKQLGVGGRTNQGNPYRDCRVRCLKRLGCYKGNIPVE